MKCQRIQDPLVKLLKAFEKLLPIIDDVAKLASGDMCKSNNYKKVCTEVAKLGSPINSLQKTLKEFAALKDRLDSLPNAASSKVINEVSNAVDKINSVIEAAIGVKTIKAMSKKVGSSGLMTTNKRNSPKSK